VKTDHIVFAALFIDVFFMFEEKGQNLFV